MWQDDLNLSSVSGVDNKNQKINRADQALTKLQEAITSGDLRPNQRLIESQLAKQLGMSRTPLREALGRLEMMGYVSILPNGGVIVTEHTPKQIRDMYEVREALETMAIKLACNRATEAELNRTEGFNKLGIHAAENRNYEQYSKLNSMFHDSLLSSCGNEKLLSILKTIRDQYFDRQILRVLNNTEWRRMILQHNSMIEAVRDKNAGQAQKLVRDHIKMMQRVAIERL
jgi:DNA-binding GntR family transcriptional regulator